MFDLYNEPHDVTWKVWRDGGEVRESPGKGQPEITYKTPGMQGLLNVVRKSGAKNVVVAGGLDWAYDLRGVVTGFALEDHDGNGVVYATHIYPWKKDWDTHVTVAIATVPIIVGEMGCEPKTVPRPPKPGRQRCWRTSSSTIFPGRPGAFTPRVATNVGRLDLCSDTVLGRVS